MIVKVQMLAFCEAGTIREVTIPDDGKCTTLDNILNATFHYGQNDFQPQKGIPSVSVGDVIEFSDALFVICTSGFHKMTKEEYDAFVATPRRDRSFAAYEFHHNI